MFLALFLGLLMALGAAPLSLPTDSASGLSPVSPPVVGAKPSHLPPPSDPHSFGMEYRSVMFHGLGGLAMGGAWGLLAGTSSSKDDFWMLVATGSGTGFALGCAYGAVTIDSSQERNSSFLATLLGTAVGGALGGGLGLASYHVLGTIELLPPGILFGAPLGALVTQRLWTSRSREPQASVTILPHRRLEASLRWELP